jgi:hypothetical protein
LVDWEAGVVGQADSCVMQYTVHNDVQDLDHALVLSVYYPGI